MSECYLDDWTNEHFLTLEKGVLLARHRLHETNLFTDHHLAQIIDTHPPEHLSVNTMGTDPNRFDWREGDRNGVSGSVIIELLKRGRLWVNARNMLDHHPDFARVFHEIYDELEARSPGFHARERSANLLISSPHAWVPYHIDIPVNMLWHIRGTKRVWVYPHFDFRFASQKVVEMVCSGEFSEDVPYDPEFDQYALVFDVQPGQLLTWPQMTPHRVTNLQGLNVSLSTEHKNPTAVRRINVHLANQFLRRKIGWGSQRACVEGPAAHAKQALARILRYARRFTGQRPSQYTYPISFQIDPSSSTGYRELNVSQDLLVPPHESKEFLSGK